MPLIQRQDRALAAQLRDAAGSTNESRSALRAAISWGYIRNERAANVLERMDHVVAVLGKLTHGP